MAKKCLERDATLIKIIMEHRGGDNIVSGVELTRIMNEKGWKTKYRNFANLVSKIIRKYRVPICSLSGKGYFWATSKQEIQASIRNLQSQIDEMQNRINILKQFTIE